jgi:hypothetical protein
MHIPQIEPVTTLSKDYKGVFSKLNNGPVVLAMRSRPKRNLARAEADPSSVIAHDELKRILLEQRSQGTPAHVGA